MAGDAPEFKRKQRKKREWDTDDLDELLDRVENLEDFASKVNDYLHTAGDDDDEDISEEEKALKELVFDAAKQHVANKLKGKGSE